MTLIDRDSLLDFLDSPILDVDECIRDEIYRKDLTYENGYDEDEILEFGHILFERFRNIVKTEPEVIK